MMAAKVDQKVLATSLGHALRHHQSGNLKAAKAAYSEILKRDPDHAEALHLLGCLLDDMGNTGQGIKMLVRAIKADPRTPSYFYNLANMQFKQGQNQEAIRHYREAVRLKPNYAAAYNNLGRVLTLVGERHEAKSCFEKAIGCARPGYPDPHHNLGIELKADGDFDGAVAAFQEALRIEPHLADAHCSLGSAYLQMHRVAEAAGAFRTAASLQPGNSRFQANVGVALLRLGQQKEAISWFERALQLDPTDASIRSNLLLATSYITANAAILHGLSVGWDRAHAAVLRTGPRRYVNVPDPERRLRIGYVSADFRNHAAAYWIEPLLAASQHTDFEVVCYSNSPIGDTVTQRLKSLADTWVECAGMSNDALADRIRLDGIDILVDLSSHTDGNRLLVFARQPAPLQFSWFGFPVSTGLQTIQYRFSDAIIDPPNESDQFYSEKLVRLERFYAAYRPDPQAPPVGLGPVTKGRGVTFSSLNTLAKITPAMLELWADILRETPNSRLLIQAAGLESDAVADSVRRVFAQRGVTADRLLMRGWTGFDEFLHLGEQADIALDPFPFNGGVTTCHALWMGLPVVTLCGESAASRVGASILTRLGLQDLVAVDGNAYRSAAVALACNPERLAALRGSLRERMHTGGLLDGAALAGRAKVAYRDMWRIWCTGK